MLSVRNETRHGHIQKNLVEKKNEKETDTFKVHVFTNSIKGISIHGKYYMAFILYIINTSTYLKKTVLNNLALDKL